MNTPINTDELHDAIKTAFTTKFPGTHVAFYDRPGEKLPSPSILLEMEDIMADDPDNNGCEQLEVTININAYAVLSYKSGNKKSLRRMATGIMAFVRGKRWGKSIGAANVIGSHPDKLEGQPEDYEVMRVEFSHSALLGDDVFAGSGPVPVHVFLGFAPDIGPDHIDDYEEVTNIPQEEVTL